MAIEIKNKIIKTELVNWKSFQFLQDDQFKKYNQDDIEHLKQSIINNNFIETFKVWQNDKTIYCLDGYHRCKALEEIETFGVDGNFYKVPAKFPASFIDCKNRKEASRFVLIYSSTYARVDEDGLMDFINLNKLDLSVIKQQANIEGIDFDKIILDLKGSEVDEDKLDEVPEKFLKPFAKKNDLFLLDGKHRVMCGDSTKKIDVEKLMDKSKADMCVTSPPYWVGKEYEREKTFEEILHHIELSTKCIENVMMDDGRIIINTMAIGRTKFNAGKREVDLLLDKWQISFKKLGWYLRNVRIWQKEGGYIAFTPQQDMQDMHWEFLGTFYKKTRKQNLCKDAWVLQGLWDIQPQTKNINHSAPFPIEIPLRYIWIYTSEENLIYEPYLGSGSTLIACEQTNRICYGMEIDPIYIDVILRRYHNLYLGRSIKCLNRKFNFDKLFKQEAVKN